MRKIRHLSMTFTATLFHILLMLRGGNSIQSCKDNELHAFMCKHNKPAIHYLYSEKLRFVSNRKQNPLGLDKYHMLV